MSRDEYIYTVNPCYGCGCYDPDEGCSMASVDIAYACRQETEEFKIKSFYYNNPDFRKYVDRYCLTYNIQVDEALTHEIVRLTYQYYKDEEVKNDKS